MSLVRRAMSRWSGGIENNPWFVPANVQLDPLSGSGSSQAMQMVAVYSCVRLIAGVVSGLPLFALGPDGKRLGDQPPIVLDPFGGQDVLDDRFLSRRDGVRQMVVSLLLRGNAYLKVLSKGPDGLPTLLQVLSPDDVTPPKARGGLYKVDGIELGRGEIVHVRGLTLAGDVVGMSPIEYARRTIELGLTAEEYGAQFFRNGASMSGVIEVPGTLDATQARDLKKNFDSAHRGVQHAHAVGILSGGATWKQITISPEDAQFLGTQAAKNLDIAMLFGVPPHMLGQVDRTTSWGKGIEEQTQGFINYTVKGWTDPIEDLWTRMAGRGLEVRCDFSELLRPDSAGRAAIYQIWRIAGVRTINEIRGEEGWDPIDGGDDIMAPLNSAHTKDPGFDITQLDPAPVPPTQEAPPANQPPNPA